MKTGSFADGGGGRSHMIQLVYNRLCRVQTYGRSAGGAGWQTRREIERNRNTDANSNHKDHNTFASTKCQLTTNFVFFSLSVYSPRALLTYRILSARVGPLSGVDLLGRVILYSQYYAFMYDID